MYGQIVDSTGMLINTPMQISSHKTDIDNIYSVALDGSRFLVVCVREDSLNSHTVYGQFIDSSGVLQGSNFIIDSNLILYDNPIYARAEEVDICFLDRFLLTYCAESGGSRQVFARFVNNDRSPGTKIAVSGESGDNVSPRVETDGSVYLIVWANDKDPDVPAVEDIYLKCRKIDQYGAFIDSTFTVAQGDSGMMPILPDISLSGNRFMITVNRSDDALIEFDVYDTYNILCKHRV